MAQLEHHIIQALTDTINNALTELIGDDVHFVAIMLVEGKGVIIANMGREDILAVLRDGFYQVSQQAPSNVFDQAPSNVFDQAT